jgi:hypothetical protein
VDRLATRGQSGDDLVTTPRTCTRSLWKLDQQSSRTTAEGNEPDEKWVSLLPAVCTKRRYCGGRAGYGINCPVAARS